MLLVPHRPWPRRLVRAAARGAGVSGLLLSAALAACSDEGGDVPDMPTQSLKSTAEQLKPQAARELTETLDLPKQVYKKAYEQARKDITALNARAFLEQLDGQIEREKDITP